MGRGHAADAEQRHGDRNPRLLRQRQDLALGARQHHAVAGQNQRPLRGVDERERLGRRPVPRHRIVARLHQVRHGGVPVHFAASRLRVLGDVHEHRTRTATGGHGEGLANRPCDVLGARDQVVVLGDRQRDAGDVGLLERVRSDELAAHLARDADNRRRVEHRSRDAGDHVGRARARRRDRDADLAARAGVAVRHVGRALLVPHEDVMNRVSQHRVVRRQNRAARISEDVGDAFTNQRFPQRLCTSHSHKKSL